jgi:hypothetical protein
MISKSDTGESLPQSPDCHDLPARARQDNMRLPPDLIQDSATRPVRYAHLENQSVVILHV